jgi:transcription initiation factor IIE alpha subunit
MSDNHFDFKCPNCDGEFRVNDEELFDAYSDDGADFTCPTCDSDMRVYGTAHHWTFEAELDE